MFGIVYSAGIFHFEADLVKVEVDISNGLPGWQMVGLPEKAVQESKERVNAAIRNSGIQLEARKTTINLAPAIHKKSGNQYDLPIAIGLLLSYEVLKPSEVDSLLFVGELSLNGELKPISGALLFASLAKKKRFKALVLPKSNVKEAALVENLSIIGCDSIPELLAYLKDGVIPSNDSFLGSSLEKSKISLDFSEVKAQRFSKRALEIAAAGGHHLLFIGPPGSGKTMLASRFASILPPLTSEQALETTKIYSVLGLVNSDRPLIGSPPFRAPHHSISYAGLVGGGDGYLAPGEITMAHNGILFLDELPEFHRDVLQTLRQPLESGVVTLVRSKGRVRFPARFQLIAAMNPCRCGFLGHPKRPCICSMAAVFQYRRKISGPLLDRIDLHVEVSPLTEEDLFDPPTAIESSEVIFRRVLEARKRQALRFQGLPFSMNAGLRSKDFKQFCVMTIEAQKFFRKSFQSLNLSARAFDRILRVARTIADLSGAEILELPHVAEAIQYRCLDREIF